MDEVNEELMIEISEEFDCLRDTIKEAAKLVVKGEYPDACWILGNLCSICDWNSGKFLERWTNNKEKQKTE